MFCTECGKQNPEQAKFCYTCGSVMTRVVAVAGDTPEPITHDIEANRTRAVADDSRSSTATETPSRFSPLPWFSLGRWLASVRGRGRSSLRARASRCSQHSFVTTSSSATR